MKTSVILPVYDAPNSLALVLEGYMRQSTCDFELVIADDGSTPEMEAIVKEFAKSAPFKVKYLWQEDRGFRKAKAMNEGVKISEGDWLIFSDGDCIPHKNFVRAHINAAKANSFCGGAFIFMQAAYSRRITKDMVTDGDYEKFLTITKKLKYNLRHLRSSIRRMLHIGRAVKTWGSNNSMDRNLFYAVNGYDENHDGITGEDLDMRNRLLRFGAKARSVWNSSYVFHLDNSADPSRLKHFRSHKGTVDYSFLNRPDAPVSCENGLVKRGKYENSPAYDQPRLGFIV